MSALREAVLDLRAAMRTLAEKKTAENAEKLLDKCKLVDALLEYPDEQPATRDGQDPLTYFAGLAMQEYLRRTSADQEGTKRKIAFDAFCMAREMMKEQQ